VDDFKPIWEDFGEVKGKGVKGKGKKKKKKGCKGR